MAKRKRSTSMKLTRFQLMRGKRLNLKAEVPMVVERVSGFAFFRTWLRMKCAVFDQVFKRRRGVKAGGRP